MNEQHGSAITDFLVSCLVIVPLFLLYPLIGNLSDVEHSAQQGARYAAWERSVHPSHAKANPRIQQEIHARIVTQQAFIVSELPPQQAGDLKDADRTLWGMAVPRGKGDRQELVSFQNEGYAGTAGHSEDAGASGDLMIIVEGMQDIDRGGLHTARVNYAINEIALLGFKGKATCNVGQSDAYLTCMDRHNAILVDDWSASDPGQVQARVQERMPFMLELWKPLAGALDKAESAFGSAGDWIGYNPFKDIRAIGDAPGHVAPDIVPLSRLGNYEEQNLKESLD